MENVKVVFVLMDDNFISAPSEEAKISSGAFVIHGFKSVEDVKLFVLLLRSGRLPYKLEIKDIK
jgi:preprotein translocase subunit SecD